MKLRKHTVETTVSVAGDANTSVSLCLSDIIVIELFKKTIEGYCPVCTFSKLTSESRKICDECLAKEEATLLHPYTGAITRIIRELMPDPPVEDCIGASTSLAMEYLGAYAALRHASTFDQKAAVEALAKLGAWVVARIRSLT